MKKYLAPAVALLIGMLPVTAKATAVDVGVWYEFGFSGGPLTSGAGTVPTIPVTPQVGDPPWTFTLINPATLTVLDLFLSVDQFEIFDGTLGSLGQTSAPTAGGGCGADIACALADLSYSRGVFSLLPGDYSITGRQILGQPGAGVFMVSETPIPAALPLFAGGLGVITLLARRRKQKAATA